MTGLFTLFAVLRTAAVLLYPKTFRRIHRDIKDDMQAV